MVTFGDKLKFYSHCQNQAARANKVLSLIKHSVTSYQPRLIKKIYTALVHPHLGFGMSVANPNFKCDLKILEKVQCRATKLTFAK